MTSKKDKVLQSKEAPSSGKRDGGFYLVVEDSSEEFPVALHYAARMAERNNARVAILRVIDLKDFQYWGKLEERMKAEIRQEAEKSLWEDAGTVNDISRQIPVIYVEEGAKFDVIENTIKNDKAIKMLILAARPSSSNPGPLISYFSSKKGLARLRVPLMILPGHFETGHIDAIA